jgi:hypothetical protein
MDQAVADFRAAYRRDEIGARYSRWLHFAYHCDPRSRIGRIPGLGALRRLHLQHHDPLLMMRHNFNITYPVGDWLFGMLCRARGGARR